LIAMNGQPDAAKKGEKSHDENRLSKGKGHGESINPKSETRNPKSEIRILEIRSKSQ
jgi:hypothetical protein